MNGEFDIDADGRPCIFQPTPRQIRTGEVCAICRYRQPVQGRSCCEKCMPVEDQKMAATTASDNAITAAAALVRCRPQLADDPDSIMQDAAMQTGAVQLRKLADLLTKTIEPALLKSRNLLRSLVELKLLPESCVNFPGSASWSTDEQVQAVVQELTVALVAIGSKDAI